MNVHRLNTSTLARMSRRKSTEPSKTPPSGVSPKNPLRSDIIALRSTSIKAILDSLPDIREDRVAAVKARLRNGFYDNPKLNDQIAGAMLEDHRK